MPDRLLSEEIDARPHPVPQIRSPLNFWGALTMLAICFTLGMAVLTKSDYRRTVGTAEEQLTHFAELFEEAVEGSLSIANLRMSQLTDVIGTEPLGTTASLIARYGRLMEKTAAEIPQIGSLVIINTDGEVIWSTAAPLIGANLSDRTYFQKATALSSDQYTVGIPIISRATDRRVTPIAWPLRSEIGTLRGVVAASLGEDYFSELLTLNDVSPDMHVEVITSNGEAAFVSGAMNRRAEATIEATKAIPALGLNIHVTRNRASVMRGYWQRTLIFGTIATALFITIILAAIRARSQSVRLIEAFRRAERDRNHIQATKREFDAIFENVGDGIVVFDEQADFHRSNRKARQLLGAADDKTASASLRHLLPSLADMNSETQTQIIQLPATDDDHGPQTVQCRVMKLHLHGDDIAYCVLEDITAEERLSATRSAFVTSVNHELRTPLTSLAGSLEVFEDRFAEQVPPGGRKLLSMATRNAERLLVLVNDILTLQAIDQEQLRFSTERVSVSQALSDAAETNLAYGLSRGIALRIDPPLEETEAFIQVDMVRLQQVFSNLISNAMKYSSAGETVTIGARLSDTRVTFHVRDTGPGIPAAGRDRVFDRFAANVHSSDIQATGTGLGLAITRELVQRQEGELTLDSRSVEDGEDNPGTTFYVSFPRDPEMEEMREVSAA